MRRAGTPGSIDASGRAESPAGGDAAVEAAASAIEAAAAALEEAVTAGDFPRIGEANAALHGALHSLERALSAGPGETASRAALRARLSPLLERHERLTGTLIELRDKTRDELAKARAAHGGARRYLESSE